MILKYTEKIDLSLKAVFLLQIMLRLPDREMNYSMDFDWMHSEYQPAGKYYSSDIDEERSTRKAFNELVHSGLIQSIEAGEGCYFGYEVSKKTDTLIRQFKKVDTSEFESLIPEKFKTRYLK